MRTSAALFLLSCLLGTIHNPALAQANVDWVRQAGGADYDYPELIEVDDAGHAYVFGYFSEATDFDGDGLADITEGEQGGGQFLAKYHPQGTLEWVQRVEARASTAKGLALDPEGNVYLTGSFSGSVDFDRDGEPDAVSIGEPDFFIASWDGTGALRWVRSAGGGGSVRGESLTVDQYGRTYLVGRVDSTVDFNGDGIVDVAAQENQDLFLVRFDPDGRFEWVRRIGTNGNISPQGIAVDGNGNVLVSGSFRRSIDFDEDGEGEIRSANGVDAFVVKYSAGGDLEWYHRVGASGIEGNSGVVVDAAGNVYIAGIFTATADFDDDGVIDIETAAWQDTYVAKYDPEGTFMWVRRGGGTAFTLLYDVAGDAEGNVLVTGFFSGDADFDDDGVADLTGEMQAAFILAYGPSGAVTWMRRAGGLGSARGNAIAVGREGAVFLAGEYREAFDADGDGQSDVNGNAGYSDLFLVKYSGALSTGIESSGEVLSGPTITTPYPNPFATQTRFSVEIPRSQEITVRVFDVLGREVARLFGGMLVGGMRLDLALDGRELPNGLYFIRTVGEDYYATRPVTLVR